MFTDADALFNPYALSLPSLFKRFDAARRGRPILVSAEPACWVGRFCTAEDLEKYYPDATNRTNCPTFLNSGQYMGSAKALLPMATSLWNMPISSFNMTKFVNTSDQLRMASYRAQNPHLIALDTTSTIFRTTSFGLIDSSKWEGVKRRTCGKDGVSSCGEFQPSIIGKLNKKKQGY